MTKKKTKGILNHFSTRSRLIIVIIIVFLALCSLCSICTIGTLLTSTTDESTSSKEEETKEEGTEDVAGIITRSTDLEVITKGNTTTTDDSFQIEGNVDETTSKVLINDTEVGLEMKNGKKYFAHSVQLIIGENNFTIKSFNVNGEEDKSYTLTILREEIPKYKVTGVTDGDTIKIMYNQKEEKVRLIGIDTPEDKECFDQEATEKLESLVGGKEVKVEFDETQGERDKYGRLLLYIWEGDIFVNEGMIKDGYAFEYTYSLPYKYQEQFKNVENEARENRNGLWGDKCACQEGEEINRECIACNKAKITRNHWDCSTYSEEITDNNCTTQCQIYTPTPTQPTPPSYTCSCSKTCPQMSSCEEAYYQLNACGCSKRDNDNDGVPCEKICPGG